MLNDIFIYHVDSGVALTNRRGKKLIAQSFALTDGALDQSSAIMRGVMVEQVMMMMMMMG